MNLDNFLLGISRLISPLAFQGLAAALELSMPVEQIVLRPSPFRFIKSLVLLQFIFAFIPVLIVVLLSALLPEVAQNLNTSPIARDISSSWLLLFFYTSLQIIIMVIVFFSWYFMDYTLDEHTIVQRRGALLGNRILGHTSEVVAVRIIQGNLARRLNYGTLRLEIASNAGTVDLHDISEPHRNKSMVESLASLSAMLLSNVNQAPTQALLAGGENQHVEFKSSFQWDYRQKRKNKGLHKPVMKSLAAFMNSSGGTLFIGVDDEAQILGLGPDLHSLSKPNVDGFENTFNMSFNKMIGVGYRQYVEIAFPTVEDKIICRLQVFPTAQPAFVQYKGVETFYIRAGNASQPLTMSEAVRYIDDRFRTKFDAGFIHRDSEPLLSRQVIELNKQS